MSGTAADSVASRNFLTFLAGVTLADLADRAWLVALSYTAVTTGSPLTATAVIAAGTLPRALLVMVGGSVADRLPARLLMIGADLLRGLVLVGALVAMAVIGRPSLIVLVLVGVLFGLADSFHLPAVGTMPRQLVGPELLVRAAGLRQLGSRLASLAGPPLAGLALALVALEGTVALLVPVFLLAAGCQFFVRTHHPRVPAERQTVVASIRDLVNHLKLNRTSGQLVLALVGLNFFVTPVVSVGVALRASQDGWGPTVLGLLLGTIGFGAILGTVLTFRFSIAHPVRVALGMLVIQGLALTVIGWAPLIGVATSLTVIGLTSGIASPLLAGTVQSVIEPEYLGRVYSAVALSDDGIMPIALIGFGVAVGLVGISWTVLVSGAGMAILMGLGLCRRPLRDLQLPARAEPPEPMPAAATVQTA